MKVAVTGGIGSGKSLLVENLRKCLPDFSFWNVDDFVRSLYNVESIQSRLISKFSTADRSKISDIVFSDPTKLLWIEHLFLPYVDQELNELLETSKNIVVEFPLLFEMGYESRFDWVVGVVADDEVRVKRSSRETASLPRR